MWSQFESNKNLADKDKWTSKIINTPNSKWILSPFHTTLSPGVIHGEERLVVSHFICPPVCPGEWVNPVEYPPLLLSIGVSRKTPGCSWNVQPEPREKSAPGNRGGNFFYRGLPRVVLHGDKRCSVKGAKQSSPPASLNRVHPLLL